MANTPAWFDEEYYLASKLAQLQANGHTSYETTEQVKEALAAAGYTPLEHFEAFGAAERTNPNEFFSANYYLAAKAEDTGLTVDAIAAAFEAAGESPWTHFQKYGWTEGLNPSPNFSVAAYLAAKAEDAGLSVEEVQAAFVANGLDLISHFYAFGEAEGIEVTPVTPVDPEPEPEPEPEDPDVVYDGEEYFLTSGSDRGPEFTGTDDNDQFFAYIEQNPLVGGVSNSLSSADRLDGGAGTDYLFAEIVPEFIGAGFSREIDIQPRTVSIERVEFEARDIAGGGSSSNGINVPYPIDPPATIEVVLQPDVPRITDDTDPNYDENNAAWDAYEQYRDEDFPAYLEELTDWQFDQAMWNLMFGNASGASSGDFTVTVDAKHMFGVDHIGSKQSDGDLVIENLTTLADDGITKRNTSEMTITMDHTDNTNSDGDASDLTVYFDDNYLISGQASEGSATYWLLDEESDQIGGPLLDHIDVDGLRFRIGDGEEIINLESDLAFQADTHEAFVAALQESLAALIASGDVPAGTTVTLDGETKQIVLDNGTASSIIPGILVTSGDGSPVIPVGFSRVEDAIGEYSVHGSFTNEHEVEDQPISIDIDLTKVGRGGHGGDLIVGGKSGHQGIEVFNVEVKGADHLPNSLGVLGTTGGDLQTVNIKSQLPADADSHASLEIRSGFNQGSLNRVDASSFYGDLILGTTLINPTNFGGEARIEDLSTLVATGGGDVTFHAEITNDNSVDPFASTGNYSYTTGAGDDEVDVIFNGDAVDTIGTSLHINTGAGDDSVTVEMTGGNLSQETMDRLENLSIVTGAGEDRVENIGTADFYISAGADSDFVYINSIDAAGTAGAAKGAWTFSTSTGDPTWVDRVLYNATVTVTFAGFEQEVDIRTTQAGNFVADQVLINEAIIEAIATNKELARLLTTELGTGDQQLTIRSLVEGANNLEIVINQPVVVDEGATGAEVNLAHLAAVRAGLVETGVASIDSASTASVVAAAVVAGDLDQTGAVGDFLTPDAGGSANETAVENYSTINMGAGANDLVVLNSHEDSVNTLEFTETWGKVSVVNFFTDAAQATVGSHALDFTAYLTDRVGTADSSSDLSATFVPTNELDVGAAAISFSANQVSVVNDFAQDIVAPANETWANLGAAQLQAALNGTADWGNIGAAGAVTAEPANFIGNSYNNIVMIENDLNAGEYKVFDVTATGTTAADDDTGFSVQLLGVIDFGNTITAAAVDFVG